MGIQRPPKLRRRFRGAKHTYSDCRVHVGTRHRESADKRFIDADGSVNTVSTSDSADVAAIRLALGVASGPARVSLPAFRPETRKPEWLLTIIDGRPGCKFSGRPVDERWCRKAWVCWQHRHQHVRPKLISENGRLTTYVLRGVQPEDVADLQTARNLGLWAYSLQPHYHTLR